MNKTIATALITLTTITMTAKDKSSRPIYRDAKASIEQRVDSTDVHQRLRVVCRASREGTQGL